MYVSPSLVSFMAHLKLTRACPLLQPIQPYSRRASPHLTPTSVNVLLTPSRRNPRNFRRMVPLHRQLVLRRVPRPRHPQTLPLMCARKRTSRAQKTLNAVMEIARITVHATNATRDILCVFVNRGREKGNRLVNTTII